MAASRRKRTPPQAPQSIAHRVAQIMGVLRRHQILGALRGKRHWPPPSEVRKAFEELGVVFLKFGQVLAMRRDLLSDPYIRELEHLHDQLPPIPFVTVKATVERQLGKPLPRLFRSFEHEPLATGTIAQVHAARTRDGRSVVVKVRRPGLEVSITEDIATLHYLAVLLESLFPRLLDLGLRAMVREFELTLRHETDFKREARNVVRFRAAWGKHPGLWVPSLVPACCSDAVLTMTVSPGRRIDLYARKHPRQMHKPLRTITDVMLRSIFENGFFHADPHPGNLFILPNGRVSFIDLGMMGELDEAARDSLKLLLEGIVNNDAGAVAGAYMELAESSEHADRAGLKARVREILQDLRGVAMEEVSFGATLAALLRAGTECGVRSSGPFLLLTRVIVIVESELRRFDPSFNFMASFRQELRRLELQHLAPKRLALLSIRGVRELERFVHDAPGDARRVLRQMADGNLGSIHAPAMEALAVRINQDIQHLSSAVAAGSLTVGGAMLAASWQDGWRGWLGSASFFCGLLIIAFIGLRSLRHFLAQRFAAWGPRSENAIPPPG